MESQPKASSLNIEISSDVFYGVIGWLVVGALACLMAIHTIDMSHTPDGYIPAGNDSFYHARRIIDTINEPSAFYEFDRKIHVPEGSWVTWPWAYDYLVALGTSGLMAMTGTEDPMTILAYVPVAWTFVNTGLFMLLAAQLGLALGWRIFIGLAFGLSATSQSLHGVGMVDHHYIELTFILLAIWSCLRWSQNLASAKLAAVTGAVLAFAPAFHVALFILQLPVLLWLLRVWIDGRSLHPRVAAAFATALVGGTCLALLGSEPFWQGMWHFSLLSWFHLYVAVCGAVGVLFLSLRQYNIANLSGLLVLAGVLAIPLAGAALEMTGFFGEKIPGLASIIETKPVLTKLLQRDGFWLYVFLDELVILAPIVLAACLIGYAFSSRYSDAAFGAFGMLALPLFFAQVRFKYFGIVFLIVGPIWIAHRLSQRYERARTPLTGLVLVLFLAAYVPSLIARSDADYRIGLDPRYRYTAPLMPALARQCESDPGVVLSLPGEGHHIRFHTECPVIANNFLLTEQHGRKFLELQQLLRFPPQVIRRQRPEIRYVIAAYGLFEHQHPGGLVTLAQSDVLGAVNRDMPLMVRLLSKAPDKIPGYELLDEVTVTFPDGEVVPYARLYRIEPLGTYSASSP